MNPMSPEELSIEANETNNNDEGLDTCLNNDIDGIEMHSPHTSIVTDSPTSKDTMDINTEHSLVSSIYIMTAT